MKLKQIKALHSKSVKELMELLKKTEKELVSLKMDLGIGKLKNVRQVREKKRDLARVKTILRKKELEVPKTKK
ncbi:50S ribosomal protein L29 [Patescibacteria group bacterium]